MAVQQLPDGHRQHIGHGGQFFCTPADDAGQAGRYVLAAQSKPGREHVLRHASAGHLRTHSLYCHRNPPVS
jgi:hypothetical protein